MKTKGIVLEARKYSGGATPPASWEDTSRFRRNGTFTNAPTWTRLPSNQWALTFVSASSQLVNFGNCGVARTLVFWISPTTLPAMILEETAAVGVSITALQIMQYPSWDNCYIDAVDTDTILFGWHCVAITSTTDVTVSAFRIGLINVTYLDGMVWYPRLFWYELSAGEIYSIFQAERGFFGV